MGKEKRNVICRGDTLDFLAVVIRTLVPFFASKIFSVSKMSRFIMTQSKKKLILTIAKKSVLAVKIFGPLLSLAKGGVRGDLFHRLQF